MIRRAKSSDRERRSSTIWARVATSFLSRAEARGLDRHRMLASAKLTEHELGDPDGRLSLVALYDLLEGIVDLSGDRLALARIARELDFAAFDALAFIVMTSPSLRTGVRAICKYQRLFSDGERYDFDEREAFACFAYTPWGPPRLAHALMAEMFVTDVVVNGGAIMGGPFDSPRVRFVQPAPSISTQSYRAKTLARDDR